MENNLRQIFDRCAAYASKFKNREPDWDLDISGLMTELLAEDGIETATEDSLDGLNWNQDLRQGGDIYNMLTRRVLKLADRQILGDDTTVYTKMHPMIALLRLPAGGEDLSMSSLLTTGFLAGYLRECTLSSHYPEGIYRTFKTLALYNFTALFSDPGSEQE